MTGAPLILWLLAGVGLVATLAIALAALTAAYDAAVERINRRDRLTITVRDRRREDRRGGDWT